MRRVTLFFLLLILGVPLAVAAMPKSSGTVAPKISGKSINVSTSQLKKFAKAYQSLAPLRVKYMKEMQHAKTPKAKKALNASAISAMKKKIQTIMPIREYEKIGRAVDANKNLRAQLIKILRKDMHRKA